jgi:hypothetical protein
VKTCEISRAAYDRGYGPAEQIVEVNNQPREEWTFEIAKYMNVKGVERARNSR